jgi:hypothetical protein
MQKYVYLSKSRSSFKQSERIKKDIRESQMSFLYENTLTYDLITIFKLYLSHI